MDYGKIEVSAGAGGDLRRDQFNMHAQAAVHRRLVSRGAPARKHKQIHGVIALNPKGRNHGGHSAGCQFGQVA
jgi:hypothetical protein